MTSLSFEHQAKSKSSSNGNRMWLNICSPRDNLQNEDPGSPPLEGGEALSELLIETHPCPSLENSHLHLLTNLPLYLEDHNAECLQDVFPAIQEALPTAQPELQLAASNSFLTILEKELVPYATFTQTFLQSILASVDSKDPIVANAWVETLLDVIDLLPKDVIRQDILSLAVNKGQISQSVSSRLSSCRMLGKICAKFESYLIKKEILPVVESLCQDVEYEVRGCMCRQLDAVSKGLGLEATKSAILPELVELANDEESYVRLAGIETVVNMLSLLDDETCTQIIVPLVKKFCENAMKSEDVTLPVVAKQLGKLCHGLSVNLTSEQKLWFLEFYRQVARLGLPHHQDANSNHTHDKGRPPMPDIVPRLDNQHQDRSTECRYCCAYNFPAMVLFARPSDFQEQLYDTFHDLACDPHMKVRKTIACGLHEVAKLLGPCVYCINDELVSLLQDECLEVLEGLIPHLPITLEAMAKEGTMGNENKLSGAELVMSAVVFCEEEISKTSNWRLHAELLEKLSCLPKCLSSNLIFHKFVPLFFQKLFTARPIPCRLAAASTLLVFLRSNPRQDQRQEICERLIDELCQGRSCHSRMLFITICDLVMDIFSKAFFKENFFMHLLNLAADPVANVRLSLCSIIPRLKTLLRFPMDAILLQELEICVGKLMIDEEDRDVSAAVRTAILELDKIEVTVETPIVLRRNAHLSSGHNHSDDQWHQQENQYLLEMEERRSSPEVVLKSPERRSLRSAGKIPVRSSIGGKESPDVNGSTICTETTTSINVSQQSKSTESNISSRNKKVVSNCGQPSTTSPTSVSRIPTLARSQMDRTRSVTKNSNSTTLTPTRKYTSPPRPTVTSKLTVSPGTSASNPVPSTEAIRRVMQRRPNLTTSTARRKSVGPGSTVCSPTPTRSAASSRLSGISRPVVNSASHIPSGFESRRFSSPLSFLSLSPTNTPMSPPPPPDDYDLELLKVYEEDEEGNDDISHAFFHQPCLSLHRGSGAQTYGGNVGSRGKIFAQWSRSQLPLRRATTPPILEGGGDEQCRSQRMCRSASSSPTSNPQSFIPRFVGGKGLYASRMSTPPSTPGQVPGQLTLSRAKSSSQLVTLARFRKATSPGLVPQRSKVGSRASSLPGTPRSISPSQHSIFENSRIPRFCAGASISLRNAAAASDGRSRNLDDSSASASRTVRRLVQELESLTALTTNSHSSPSKASLAGRHKKNQGLPLPGHCGTRTSN